MIFFCLVGCVGFWWVWLFIIFFYHWGQKKNCYNYTEITICYRSHDKVFFSPLAEVSSLCNLFAPHHHPLRKICFDLTTKLKLLIPTFYTSFKPFGVYISWYAAFLCRFILNLLSNFFLVCQYLWRSSR